MKKSLLGLPLFLTSLALAAPNDPYFPQQWGLHNDGTQTVMIDADDLHTLQQKGVSGVDIGWLDAQSEASKFTAPVTVAVIDSGIDPAHPDLQGRISPDGFDFLANSATLQDTVGHGTHVSGIIAANAGNGVGISGISPNSVKILPLRILSDDFQNFAYQGKLISDYAADAIRYAVAHHASIINMSLGWPKIVDTPNARSAVQQAIQAGVLVVVAAGNDRKDEPTYPCAYEGVLCVGSITNTGAMAVYSNLGGGVDVLAPGDQILSTYPTTLESQTLRIQGYEMLSGTSQAAPHVAGAAAVLRSAFPNISLNELEARLLVSGGALPQSTASLYGLINLKRALDAQPQPVYLPDFKSLDAVAVDESSLAVSGSIPVFNLWQASGDVQIKVTVNGQAAGSAQAASLATGQSVSVPWNYRFSSLDDSASLHLVLQVSDQQGDSKEFAIDLPAVRAMQNITNQQAIPVAVSSTAWIGSTNGHLFSKLTPIKTIGDQYGLPLYYQQTAQSAAGSTVQIFDPSSATPLRTIQIPAIARVTQILRLNANADGKLDWAAVGYGKTSAGQIFFQFYFLGPDFQPLWGTSSTWQITLDGTFGQSILRDYSTPGSWIASNGKLVPSFSGSGVLPDPDNYPELDPMHFQTDTHLYYLAPQPAANGIVPLVVRAIDNADFRSKNGDVHLQTLIPQTNSDRLSGHLRILMQTGSTLDASSSILDVASTSNFSVVTAPGWDSLSAAGQPIQVLGLTSNQNSSAFLNFFDQERGSLAWASAQGTYSDTTQFSFASVENPITGLIGAFNLPDLGRVCFLESGFDLVGIRQTASGVVTQTLGIDRDSSFPGEEFSEMFTPVLVGSAQNPLPGVYIDSTLVRGDEVSVAVWDSSTEKLEKPLRYSLQVPDTCVQMDPIRLDSQSPSFALPLLCQSSQQIELRVVQAQF